MHTGVCVRRTHPSLLMITSSALALTHVTGGCWHSNNQVKLGLLEPDYAAEALSTRHVCDDSTGRCSQADTERLSGQHNWVMLIATCCTWR